MNDFRTDRGDRGDQSKSRGRGSERVETSDGRVKHGDDTSISRDVSAERRSREASTERILHSTDEDRIIRDSETEADKTLGVRSRYEM